MPPIINSDDLGKIQEKNKNILIEVTGTSQEAVHNVLNIMTLSLADRGGEIYEVKIKYAYKTDFGKEDPRPAVPMQEEYVAEQEEIEELDEVTEAPKTVSEEESDIQQSEALNPNNVRNPSDDSEISNLFNQFKLDRDLIKHSIQFVPRCRAQKYMTDSFFQNHE